MENSKLTEEELKSIKDLQALRQNTVLELGNLESYQYDIDTRKKELHTTLDEIKTSDLKLGKSLNEKYGDGSIDLDKGEFISQEKA